MTSRMLCENDARSIMVFMTDSADHVTGKTGLTLTITASKNAGAFAAITPTVTERGNGWYALALTASHVDTVGDLVLHITATGADPTDVLCFVGVNTFAAAIWYNTDSVQAYVKQMADSSITAGTIATDAIDSEALAADAIADIQSGLATAAALAAIDGRIPAALVSGRMDASVGAMANDVITAAAIAASALAEITTDVLTGEAMTELPQAKPPATPTLSEAIMLLYMAARNLLQVTADEKRIANDAGTIIAKKALSDSGTVYEEAEMVTGP